MGNIDAFHVDGLKCYFGSNDHYPHHFEVFKRGAWLIRVYFLRSTKKRGLNWDYKFRPWGVGPLPSELEEILQLVLKHKRRLLRQWNSDVIVAKQKKETLRISAQTDEDPQ